MVKVSVQSTKAFGNLFAELSGIREHSALRLRMVQLIARDFVPADDGSFDRLDYVGRNAQWDSIRPLPGESRRMQVCSDHFDSHPILRVHRNPNSPSVLRLSDLLPRRLFQRTAIYEGLYGPIGMSFMLVVRLSSDFDSGTSRTITLLRSDRDFSDREVQILQAIQPLANTLINTAVEREQLVRLSASALSDRGAIWLDSDTDRIAHANSCSKNLLQKFFAWTPSRSLPEVINNWICRGESPLIHRTINSVLKVSLLRDGEQRLLLCDEQPPEPQPAMLQVLGLTPRQSEVLFWISQGKTDGEISVILGTSVHTIHRHCEAVFDRLNVESRASAMRLALEVLSPK